MSLRAFDPKYSPFKTESSMNDYLEYYDQAISEWPVEIQEIDIENEYGCTHILHYGNPSGPVLVLLHGMRSNSTIWIKLAKELSEYFNVYSIDIIGDLGKSVAKKDLQSENDYCDWLNEIFSELALENITLCGQSNGGFQAASYAKNINSKVAKLILLAPAATMQDTRISFFIKTMKTALLPTNRRIKRFLRVISYDYDNWNKVIEHMNQLAYTVGVNKFSVYPRKLKQKELQLIRVPSLLIYGENEVMYSIKNATIRAKKYIQKCEVATLKNCKHSIPNDAPTEVCSLITDFILKKEFA
jgi:pimeloyl-ACP methyl ester carboxylesterase